MRSKKEKNKEGKKRKLHHSFTLACTFLFIWDGVGWNLSGLRVHDRINERQLLLCSFLAQQTGCYMSMFMGGYWSGVRKGKKKQENTKKKKLHHSFNLACTIVFSRHREGEVYLSRVQVHDTINECQLLSSFVHARNTGGYISRLHVPFSRTPHERVHVKITCPFSKHRIRGNL